MAQWQLIICKYYCFPWNLTNLGLFGYNTNILHIQQVAFSGNLVEMNNSTTNKHWNTGYDTQEV